MRSRPSEGGSNWPYRQRSNRPSGGVTAFWKVAAIAQFAIIATTAAVIVLDREDAIELIRDLPEVNIDLSFGDSDLAAGSSPLEPRGTGIAVLAQTAGAGTAAADKSQGLPVVDQTSTAVAQATRISDDLTATAVVAAREHTRDLTATAIARRPTPTPTPEAGPSGLRQDELASGRQQMLDLINQARLQAGLVEVVLDDNPTAQLHANDLRRDCILGHWGTDGLKPYMRYTIQKGTDYPSENVSGVSYCPPDPDRYVKSTLSEDIIEAHNGLMDSPGHRRNILDPAHRKVGIGVSSSDPNVWVVQLFASDYIEFPVVPTIDAGTLSFAYRIGNGAIESDYPPNAFVEHDPLPYPLTRGQIARTYCSSGGRAIAGLRPALDGGYFWPNDTYEAETSACPDPYLVPSESPSPSSYDEASLLHGQAYAASEEGATSSYLVPWVTAHVEPLPFGGYWVEADISEQLAQYGPGVYSLVIWAEVDGEDAPVSHYSIFVE